MKSKILILILIVFVSCISIKKSDLMKLETIGDKNNHIKLNGYFYQVKKIKTHPTYRNEYGGISEDSTITFEQIRIIPLILYPDGTVLSYVGFSGFQGHSAFNYQVKCDLEDNNTLESAFEHFECYLSNKEKDNLIFINKKAEIWGQGVYKINNNKIQIQIFYNSLGNYNLWEQNGIILNDSTFVLNNSKDYGIGKEKSISKTYKFHRKEDFPKIESYILKNRKKFK